MESVDSPKWSGSTKLIVLVVAVALCLDNIILTVIGKSKNIPNTRHSLKIILIKIYENWEKN